MNGTTWKPEWGHGGPAITISLEKIYACIDSATQPTDSSRQTAQSIKDYLAKFEAELKERQAYAEHMKSGPGFFPSAENGEAKVLGLILAINNDKETKKAAP